MNKRDARVSRGSVYAALLATQQEAELKWGGGGGGGGVGAEVRRDNDVHYRFARTLINLHAAQNLPTNKEIGQVIKSISGILAGVAANHIT